MGEGGGGGEGKGGCREGRDIEKVSSMVRKYIVNILTFIFKMNETLYEHFL